MKHFKLEPLAQTIAVVTASTFAVKTYEYVVSQGVDSYLGLGLVLPVSSIIYFLIELLLLYLPKRFRPVRRLLSRISTIEGYWFEAVRSEGYPLSIVCIEYHRNIDSYVYHGINYKVDGTRNASFESRFTSVDDDGRALTFHFEATVLDTENLNSEPSKGYGKINFTTGGAHEFTRGEGEFFERDPAPNWRTFELYKIPRGDVQQALSKAHAVDDQDYYALLKFVTERRRKRKEELGSFEIISPADRAAIGRQVGSVVDDSVPVLQPEVLQPEVVQPEVRQVDPAHDQIDESP